MQNHSAQFTKIQLAAIIFCAFVLISRPQLASLIAVFVGLSLAFSMGSAMAVGHYYSSKNIEKLSRQHATLLATHFGGLLCNLIMINEAFNYIRQ